MAENACIKRKNKKEEHHIDNDEKTKLPELFCQYLTDLKYSVETVKNRRLSMKKFLFFLAEMNIGAFQDVTLEDLEEYRRWMHRNNLGANTAEAHLRTVRTFFNYLEKRSFLFENPATDFVILERQKKLPRVISVNEVNRLLNEPDCSKPGGIRDRAMLELLYATGMRRKEILRLSVFDIDPANQTVRVFGKGSRERVLPIGKHAAYYIELYLRETRPKFLDSKASPVDALWINSYHQAYSKQMLNIMVREYAKKAGLGGRGVSTHTLRRTCATHMLTNGAHPMAVAEMLGHAQLRTLTHYLKVTISELRETHAKSKPGG